ncbi:hypothetical protein J7M23_09290 [Candidatus Sumerlaeota bacterium]|nr:hypothetical protein [Candidatus Sumerlaeota bacterium]
MLKQVEIKLLLLLILVALVVNGYLTFVSMSKSSATLAPLHPALAKVPSTYYYAITEDTYIITTNSSGQDIYLYYFEKREPKEDSRLYYLKHISARETPRD